MVLDAESKTLAAGLEFRVIGEFESPLGVATEIFAQLGKLSERQALRYTVNAQKKRAAILLRDAPKAMKEASVEALLVDQTSLEGGTVADFLGIPFITICSSVVMNRDDSIPPYFPNWNYDPTWQERLRDRFGYQMLKRMTKPITEVINHYRQEWQLPPQSSSNERYSQLAQISQQPAQLEFPVVLQKFFQTLVVE